MATSRKTPIKTQFLLKITQERGWKILQQKQEPPTIALTTLSKYADNGPKQGMLLIAEETKTLGIDPAKRLKDNLGWSV